jgi:hypothetical protein
MLLGGIYTRQNGLIEFDKFRLSFFNLKMPEFYQLNLSQQLEIFNHTKQLKVIGCHRQYGFDFLTVDSTVKVVSIVMDRFDILESRIKNIHLIKHKFSFNAESINKLKDSVPFDLLVKKDYEIWSSTNILDTDIKLNFSTMIDNNLMKQWCDQNKFTFNQACFDDWIFDINTIIQ